MCTARELPGAFVADVVEVDALECGVHGGDERGAGKTFEARVEEEVLTRSERLPEQVILRAHSLQSRGEIVV